MSVVLQNGMILIQDKKISWQEFLYRLPNNPTRVIRDLVDRIFIEYMSYVFLFTPQNIVGFSYRLMNQGRIAGYLLGISHIWPRRMLEYVARHSIIQEAFSQSKEFYSELGNRVNTETDLLHSQYIEEMFLFPKLCSTIRNECVFVDYYFTEMARKQNMTIHALDSDDLRFRMNSLLTNVTSDIAEKDTPFEKKFKQYGFLWDYNSSFIFEHFQSGKENELCFWNEMMNPLKRQFLVHFRNIEWVEGISIHDGLIAKIKNASAPILCVVGEGHLIGEFGLINLFQKMNINAIKVDMSV